MKKLETLRSAISTWLYQLATDLAHEVYYDAKSFLAIRSGYIQMEQKLWEGNESAWENAEPGDDDPYYICARFANGRHIPLPILANWHPDENRLQKLAIRLGGGVSAEALDAAENLMAGGVSAQTLDPAENLAT